MTKGIFICFQGMDGSGKSTLAKYLYEELTKRNLEVSYVWWLAGDDSLYRRLLRALAASQFVQLEMDGNSQRVAVGSNKLRNRIFRSVFPTTLILDYLRFAFVKVWVPKLTSRHKTIIFDRYIYDVILAISHEFSFTDARRRQLLKLCNVLVPKPDLIFVLDVSPEVALFRKSEELGSIEHARDVWELHQGLNSIIGELTSGRIIQIDNTQDRENVKADVLEVTLGLLPDD